jgi:hypothetical protein
VCKICGKNYGFKCGGVLEDTVVVILGITKLGKLATIFKDNLGKSGTTLKRIVTYLGYGCGNGDALKAYARIVNVKYGSTLI